MQTRMPDSRNRSIASRAPGTGNSPFRSMAARNERSKDSAAASARPGLPGNSARNTSTGGSPSVWWTATMWRA